MRLEQHVEALREERDRLRADVADAEAKVQDVKSQLKRVDDALAALTGSGAAKKRKAGGGVKTSEVIVEMRDVLQAGPLRSKELEKQVGARLKGKSKTLTGYGLRFKQAVKDSVFSLNGELVSLAGEGELNDTATEA